MKRHQQNTRPVVKDAEGKMVLIPDAKELHWRETQAFVVSITEAFNVEERAAWNKAFDRVDKAVKP